MIVVPSYQLVPFLAWLHRRDEHLSGEDDQLDHLRALATQFLRDHRGYGEWTFKSLDEVMAIFQICPRIAEPTLIAQMHHFASCGHCIDEMNMHRESFPFPVEFRSENALHPLLCDFVEWCRGSELESQLHRFNRHNWDERRHPHKFRLLIADIGHELESKFNQYLSEVHARDPHLIEGYERWRSSVEDRALRTPAATRLSERQRRPIQPTDSPRTIAEKLAGSAHDAIRHGSYDDILADQPQLAHFLSLLTEGPENVVQTLEFLNWIRDARQDGLTIPGSIPSTELESLALQFCEEGGYSNGRTFSRQAAQWLSGKGPDHIIDRIARYLGLGRFSRFAETQLRPRNLLDRYGSVRFHALFLFLSVGDFPGFIEAYWRDLHHLTGDHLDIYYSQKDLSERISGYEIVEQLRSVEFRADALPSFLLWEDTLEAYVTVPLQSLTHNAIFETVKAIVQSIQDGCSLDEIGRRGLARVMALQQDTH
jgi:hypothetical protein